MNSARRLIEDAVAGTSLDNVGKVIVNAVNGVVRGAVYSAVRLKVEAAVFSSVDLRVAFAVKLHHDE